METIGKYELWSFFDDSGKVKFVKSNNDVR